MLFKTTVHITPCINCEHPKPKVIKLNKILTKPLPGKNPTN